MKTSQNVLPIMCVGVFDAHSSCTFLALLLSTVTGLTCYCAYFIDGINLTPLYAECTSNYTCEMDGGWCYAMVSLRDGSLFRSFSCIKGPIINNTLNFGVLCNIAGIYSKQRCCSTHFCNRELSLQLPIPKPQTSSSRILLPTSAPSQSNGSPCDSNGRGSVPEEVAHCQNSMHYP